MVPILEVFTANPFWEAFYDNPAENAFETEVTFLMQHYHQIKVASSAGLAFVADFSLSLDLAYSRTTLSRRQREVFAVAHKETARQLGPPDLLVYLRCSPQEELRRIRLRGRAAESTISLKYLSRLSRELEDLLAGGPRKSRVLVIDSSTRNFAADRQERKSVVAEVCAALSG
jgi:deoxyadenosine/deoxycytidine kinase